MRGSGRALTVSFRLLSEQEGGSGQDFLGHAVDHTLDEREASSDAA